MIMTASQSLLPGEKRPENDFIPADQDAIGVVNVTDSVSSRDSETEAAPPLARVVSDGHLSRVVTPGPYTIFTRIQKSFIVAMISVAATFSGLSGNIYFPAIPDIASDLGVSKEAVTLTVTAYMIFQGLSPSFWGALSDSRGRRLTYICTFIVYIGACIGLAETRHYFQLVILRCLQSTGSASTIAIGAGVLGDITTREERGGYMGIYNAGLLAPVAIGPIIGGAMAGSLGWRSIFWFLTIFAGAFLILLIFFLPETLRSLVGNGSFPAKGLAESPLAYLQRRRHLASLPQDGSFDLTQTQSIPSPRPKVHMNPIAPILILFNKQVTSIILFLSLYYTVWQMIISSMSSLFSETYGLNSTQLGLCFIPNGVGCVLGTYATGKYLDWDYAREKVKHATRLAATTTHDPEHGPPPTDVQIHLQQTFPLEKTRLRPALLNSLLEIISVLIFGWTVHYHIHISVPIIFIFVLGWSSTSIQGVITTLLVDVFHKRGASATATINLARCLMGAGGTAAVLPLTNSRLGTGWTFTMLSGLLVVGLGFLWVQVRWGPRWRVEWEMEEKEKEKELEVKEREKRGARRNRER
ncbi:putative mfs multidrug [Phaeomoniella chlamydospora]|uniref:Putative mfs multidrug n=1 Tax=Phaeomoniella chlamydospora TaxID=158046 RepID=A0A0G2F0S9_PHACM|nr:putative mfs multidrug [Phaeomoniella chlamydospora]